jgi:DNA polymerase elongation subunit (family B)
MYQSIYYDRDEKQYYLRDDKKGWHSFKYYPTYYLADPDGEMETLEGTRVSPVNRMKDWQDTGYYEKDVDKDVRVLVDLYYETDDTPSFHNIVYIDIECEIAGALTEENIKDPKGKVTSVALYDNNTQQYYCLILDDTNSIGNYTEDNKTIISYPNEKELLHGFLDKWLELDPTIIAGWNSGFFDIPYLYYRIKKVLGDASTCYFSPLNKMWFTPQFPEQPVNIAGISHLDYMQLFKKYITKQEPSYKLGDIGKKYAELDKIEYQGSLDKLFKEDPHKFIDYNLRDVEIIVELEKRLKFIELTVTICHLCHTTYESIYYSTLLNEGAILTYLKRKGIVSPNKPTTYNPALKDLEEEYAGGYLKDPIPGLYEWVIDLDFTSLYPSIIRSLNMGIETLVGRIVNRDKYDNQWSLKELKELDPELELTIEKVKKNRTTVRSEIKVKDLIQIIETNDLIISAPGVMFRKDKSSVVCEILADWFAKRQEYKKLMKKAYKEDNDHIMGSFYDRRQHAYKIKLNDVYGVFAINGWRYTDGNKFISKAITLTGQRLTQESIKFVNKWMNEQLETEDKDYIVTSDTDSLFIQVKSLIQHRNPDLDMTDREAIVKSVLQAATEIQKLANENLHIMVQELFNVHYPNESHYLELKQEVVLERGYFAGKRRYAQFIVNKEGVPVEELDLKGLDLMKSNFPPLFKQFGENLIKQIMFGKSKPSIDSQILDFRESLQTIEWKKILKPTGLKQLREYVESPPKLGEIFSKLKTKCPINTKAAIFYNDLLRFKKLDKKHSLFQVGDKMFIAYLKNNPYKIDVIGFNGYDDPPEVIEFVNTYIDRDGIFDSVMKNKLETLYEDIGWGKPIFNRNVHKFFKFT